MIKPYLGIIILATACLAVYFPIFSNDFLYQWDDQWVLMNHYTEGGVNLQNLWSILTQFHQGQYGPVNEYMYLAVYSFFGYNPFVFHIASLLLHIGCVCLSYIIILRLFTQILLHQSSPLRHCVFHPQSPSQFSAVAFITVLLFAIHPMNVESVAWISASKILVYAFFYLLATYTCMIYLDRKKIGFYILTVVLFALSFGGKEQAVVFPVWMLILYRLYGHTLRERKVWIEVAPFFVMAVAFGIVTMLSQAANGSGILSNQETYPLWQRFVLGCYSLVEYIVKFTFPYNLLYIYPFPMTVGEALPAWILLYPAIIFIIVTALWNYLKKAPFSIGLAFFLIHIALVLHIIPLSRYVVIADRYNYLACIGLSFIVAWYAVAFLASRKATVRKIAIGCLVCIALCLSIYSNLRCRDWKDTDSIKKELRELLKQREDYVPPPEIEKLMGATSFRCKHGDCRSSPAKNRKNKHILC